MLLAARQTRRVDRRLEELRGRTPTKVADAAANDGCRYACPALAKAAAATKAAAAAAATKATAAATGATLLVRLTPRCVEPHLPGEPHPRAHPNVLWKEVGATAKGGIDGGVELRLPIVRAALDPGAVRELQRATLAPRVTEIDRGSGRATVPIHGFQRPTELRR